MENKSEIKYYYSDIDEVEKSLNKIGFKIVEYTSMVDTSKNKIKDFLKSITTWEIYYLFEKK